ncbi:adenylate/guanylate cyclase domain-containing protein [Pseudobacteriovorax antillogorgiicola]|uniref:Adenylate and Guanylate cyclase catalytic domain-containing protein n=1 Tax=Pseudobacteriovorax antillogorgiicola TaxID=1513793 RepID=A0A1Y6BR36_9BACT|nr:adenylate/guanylate cyclase domain-containing protein [Pseudobacteriovorax antillogorgiicola]TCS54669.1 adenylate/guanylate cyclase family protein [Pseudobacteriovorax antillogorgiicola]SMF16727.1 Adenylate and Guanylate cyclase catalytic domain-containing protein [Pseudobacteriovorax antillogorgiicola]
MKSSDIIRSINRHAAEHQEDYYGEVNSAFEAAFGHWKLPTCLICIMTLISVLIVNKTGQTLMIFAHVPSCAILAFYTRLVRSGIPAVTVFEAAMTAGVLEFVGICVYYGIYNANLLQSTSIGGVFTILWATAFDHRHFTATIRCIGLSLILAYVPIYFDGSLFQQVSMSALTSISLGFFVNQILILAFKGKFYLVSMSDSSRNHAYEQMKKLVYPHQLYLMQKKESLEATMPRGSAESCIISFDIQGSTAIGHIKNHEFFESVIHDCHTIMMENYDPDTLSANAYMIKEMGDGFLCAVGFPFHCEGKKEQVAYELALRFVEVVNRCSVEFLDDQEAYCSIGIGIGSVVGDFPTSGLKTYDLYGAGIIKATRYESTRKPLLKHLSVSNTHVIIIETTVWECLEEEVQQNLKEYALEKFKVRDHQDVKCLYYQLLDSLPQNLRIIS